MRALVAVVLGGLLGSGLRLTADTLVPHAGDGFPVDTLVINLVGSLVLGALVARVWPITPTWLRAGLGPGLLGSFTTFSALALAVVQLTAAGKTGMAVLYLVVSLAGGFAAAALGLRLGTPHGRPGPAEIGPDE